MALYGSDKPDIRFDMAFVEINAECQGKDFGMFDNSEAVLALMQKDVQTIHVNN
jgi:aspartyl-tRNA synthetase